MIFDIFFVMLIRFIRSVEEVCIIFSCYFVVIIWLCFEVVMVVMLVVVIIVFMICVLSFVLVVKCIRNVDCCFIILLRIFVVLKVWCLRLVEVMLYVVLYGVMIYVNIFVMEVRLFFFVGRSVII